MKRDQNVFVVLLVMMTLSAIACGPNSPANTNNRPAVTNANQAQSNSSPANSATTKPSAQPIMNTKGSIMVTSVPPGAKVLLVATDEGGAGEPQSKGVTPTTIAGLDPGKYTIDLEKPGYKFYQKEVVVKQGTVSKVNASLKKH